MKKKLLIISVSSLLVVSATAIVLMPKQKTFEACAFQTAPDSQIGDNITLSKQYIYDSETQTYVFQNGRGYEYDGYGKEIVSDMNFTKDDADCLIKPTQYDFKTYNNDGLLIKIEHFSKFLPNGELVYEYSDYDSHRNYQKLDDFNDTYGKHYEYEYTYDDAGNIIDKFETVNSDDTMDFRYPQYNYYHYEHDSKGRIICEQNKEMSGKFNPNDKSILSLGEYFRYDYIDDENGKLIESTKTIFLSSGNSKKDYTKKYIYNNLGNISEEQKYGSVNIRGGSNPFETVEGLSEKVTYSYNERNQISKITTTKYGYDKPSEEFYVYSQDDVQYSYDNYGRLTQYDYFVFGNYFREVYRYDDLGFHMDGLVPTLLNKDLSFNYKKKSGQFTVEDMKLKLGFFDTKEKFDAAKKGAKDYGVALISKANLGGSDFFKAYSEKDEFMSVISFFGKEGIVDENKVLDPNGDYVAFDTVINVPEDKMDEEVCAVIYFTYEDKTEFTYLEDVSVKSAAQNYLNMDREYTATEKAVLSYLAK